MHARWISVNVLIAIVQIFGHIMHMMWCAHDTHMREGWKLERQTMPSICFMTNVFCQFTIHDDIPFVVVAAIIIIVCDSDLWPFA